MKNRNWFLPCLLLLMAAALLLREGEQRRQRAASGADEKNAPARPGLWERFTRPPAGVTGRQPSASTARPAPVPSMTNIASLGDDPRFPFRVRNTKKKDAELFRSETAVLLRNALVETREPLNLNIPAHLRAQGDPGSWLVQARGTIDDKFRAVLRGAGVEIVSYVPNNALLVRADASLAQQLRMSSQVRNVLPFEPFYKLDMNLLPLAVRGEAIPAGRWLNVVLFSGTQERAKADLRALGAVVKTEQRFPFGHVVTIAPSADSLVALAQMPAVQNIEAYHAPVLMNDLSRVRLDVSVDPTLPAPAGNWLGLTGSNVVVGLIGSGLDTGHPELAGQFFTNAINAGITDSNGHDTFVGGIIAALGTTPPSPDPYGSIAGSSFRGIASSAKLYPLSLYDRDYTNYGNVWLITNSAQATNTLAIVNNSWGYSVFDYDINSALFDEAVRDALPYLPNDQPITHVFAAGNSGGANSGGTGGQADTITSPGNAKNVITVGASELLRFVPSSTNDLTATAHSDNLGQVADFSSRGNVGVGIEGEAGRFKPDLVAPGAYVVSLRSTTFASSNLTETDAQLTGNTYWRYDSGSSFAAANVSGVLALMQEFFAVNFSRTNKPSLNKALLINRAYSLGLAYDFAVNNPVTHQGWGIPSLSNTVPSIAAGTFDFLTNTAPSVNAKIVIVDESSFVTNHLASGQYHAFDVTVPASASVSSALKITLAWTDPAGNPISSAKLVNDLDLYVTNLVAGGLQYEGNNFPAGSIFTQETPLGSESQRDSVNNVENVFIPLGNTNAPVSYRVYVIGRKVNVNAVSANGTNGWADNVVQDYSLVISTDDPARTITVASRPLTPPDPFWAYTNRLFNIVTNGMPYLNERVGANSPLFTMNGTDNANTNGVTNQWNFYVFTNQDYASPTATNMVTNIVGGVTNVSTNTVNLPLTNGGPYVVFATFLPPNLARRRMSGADVDMYVARGSVPNAYNLTNLDPAVLSHPNILRSTNRGGYELISLTDSFVGPPGEVFYIGIKSEDQQGGQYGFLAAASPQPFSTNDANSNLVLTLFPAPIAIPDGTPETPGGVMLFGICTTNIVIQSADPRITYVHENLGDLVGTVTHNDTVVTLNNHSITPLGTNPAPGGLVTNALLYDDFRNPPDGPGDVTDYIGQDGIGLWLFEVYDNAPFQTGRVDSGAIFIRPFTNALSTNAGTFFRTFTLEAGQSAVDFLDVPAYATNLDVDVVGGLAGVVGPVPQGQGVDLLAGAPPLIPTSSNYSIGTLDLDNTDTFFPHLRISSVQGQNLTNNTVSPGTPSLTPGRWYFRVINNTAGQLTLTVRYTLGLDLSVSTTELTYTNVMISLLDNYTTNLYMTAPQDRVIAGVDVGLAIKHPRISDLVIHLISPSGTKVLLFEDRFGTNGLTTSNLYANFSENTNYSTHIDTNGYAPLGFLDLGYLFPVKFVPAPFSAVVSPPRLFTNATNLPFGYMDNLGTMKESPGGLGQFGHALFMAGKVDRSGTNDAFIASYQTPILTNVYTSTLITNAAETNLLYLPVTNWTVTNFWTGPFGGYRGSNQTVSSSEKTLFNAVAANSDGVFAVGQTRNFFPPAGLTWSGNSNRYAYDVDLGCTSGIVRLTHLANASRPRVIIEYEGHPLLDFLPLLSPGQPTNYFVTLPFNGKSHFMRVIVNPLGTNIATLWTNTLNIYRDGGMEYAASTYVGSGNFQVPNPAPSTPPAVSQLSQPRGVALDTAGNVYVSDSGNNQILRFDQKLSLSAVQTNGTYVPFTVNPAPLSNPGGLAVHTNGDIYVADTGTNQVKRFSSDGTLLFTWGDPAGSSGSEDSGAGGFANGRFNAPEGVTIGTNGVVYVSDYGSGFIRQIATNGTVSTIPVPALNGPRGLLVYGDIQTNSTGALVGFTNAISTNLFIAEATSGNIVHLYTSNGTWFSDLSFATGFREPSGIARDGYGNIFFTVATGHRVRRLMPGGGSQIIAGDLAAPNSGNLDSSLGASARFNGPRGLAADYFGNLFVADSGNNAIRAVSPYQATMPTNSVAVFFPFSGPTNNPVMGGPPVLVSRGITNSVFGLEGFGAASRDSFNGVVSSPENGTNFLYAVGSAQFSTNGSLVANNRMFLTKFAANGAPVWTRGYMSQATFGVSTNGAGAAVPVLIDGGDGYTNAPVAFLSDPSNPSPALQNVPLTLTVAGGVVTGISSPASPIGGPFVSPTIYVEPPPSPDVPGNALAVAYGTNVIAAGYTNVSNVPLTTNNLPFLMCLNATNGNPVWATNSTNSGHYTSVAVFGDKLIAVGSSYVAGDTTNTTALIDLWSLSGGTQLVSYAMSADFGLSRTSSLSQVIAIDSLDRAYAVGSVINSDMTVDAVLVEIDLTALALASSPIVSIVTNNITNFNNFAVGQSTNYGKAIATDGVDLYVAVEGPGYGAFGTEFDRQAAVFRYRAKNFYLAEESLNAFIGERSWGTNMFWTTNTLGAPTNYVVTNHAWRLQIADTRAGGTNGTAQVVAWNLNFSYAATNTTALTVASGVSNTITLLSSAPQYVQVPVPSAAGNATNLVSASGPVRVTFHPASLPLAGDPGTRQMFSDASTGSFVVSTNTNSVARLRPGSAYYLGIQALNPTAPVTVSLMVNFDRTVLLPTVVTLTDGVPLTGFIPRTASFNNYAFNVPANASAAAFELLNLDGNVNLYLLRSNSPSALPGTTLFDFRSANPGAVAEQIFLATNGAASSLTPGTWFLGVQNADNAPVNFTVRATSRTGVPYTVVTAPDAQSFNGVTTPGNAPNSMFKFTAPAGQTALLFEARDLSGAGDLVVRRNTYPVDGAVDASGIRSGATSELVVIRTNGVMPSLAGDWYFGVLNPGTANVSYTVMARQPVNGVLLSGTPIQILGQGGTGALVSGQNFGFDLDVVPGEKYQVQYATNLTSAWLVLTNIVAPPDGVINFMHSGALSNRNLYYRIQVVP